MNCATYVNKGLDKNNYYYEVIFSRNDFSVNTESHSFLYARKVILLNSFIVTKSDIKHALKNDTVKTPPDSHLTIPVKNDFIRS